MAEAFGALFPLPKRKKRRLCVVCVALLAGAARAAPVAARASIRAACALSWPGRLTAVLNSQPLPDLPVPRVVGCNLSCERAQFVRFSYGTERNGTHFLLLCQAGARSAKNRGKRDPCPAR